jgi:hypothetical protein
MNPIRPLQLYFPRIYFNSTLPSTPSSCDWFLSFRLSNQNFVRISHLPHVCYKPGPCQSHYSSAGSMPPLFHLTSSTPLNVTYIWQFSWKNPSKSEALWNVYLHAGFLRREVVSSTPNHQVGDYPLSAVRDCLFNIFAAALPISGGLLLHPQPEDAPCRGDKGPN